MEMMSTLKDHSMIMPSSNKQIVFPHVMSNKSRKCYLVVNCTMGGSAGRVSRQKEWEESLKVVVVDYDEGKHEVKTEVRGLGKEEVPKRYRKRLKEGLGQHDWTISQVVAEVLKLEPHGDIDNLLNHWAGRFHRKNFPILILEISKTGALKHSVRVFNWMKNQRNYRARNDIYNIMIRLYARHNQTDQARGLFFEMQEWRCKPDVETYNALINVHGRAGQWRWAMKIFDDMLRAAVPPSRSSYNNLINACGSSGQWEQALKVCKRMTENGVGPDLVTHNIVLSAFKNGGQYRKALSYFELMKRKKVKADTITFNIIISCLAKLEQYDKAIEIFYSMKRLNAIYCKPNVVTFNTVMHAYAACGQVTDVKATFEMMIAEGIRANIVCYNTLISAYASLGMHKDALEAFNLLKESGFRPDIISYTSLINAYGKSGQPHKAREIFDFMSRNSLKQNTVCYNALIDAYGSAGCLEEALKLLHEMGHVGVQPNVVTICTLLAACGQCGQPEKTDSIISGAISQGIQLNANAYNTAIANFMNGGMYDRALCIHREMQEKGIKPDGVTYSILINGACKVASHVEAQKHFDEMLDMHIDVTVEACSALIDAYSKQGLLNEAELVLSKMKVFGCLPNVITYTTLIHAYGMAGMKFCIFSHVEFL
eukprot:Gb_07283 [translate_table: standard]